MELFIRSVDMLALQQAASIALLRKPHLHFLLLQIFQSLISYEYFIYISKAAVIPTPFRRQYDTTFPEVFCHPHTHTPFRLGRFRYHPIYCATLRKMQLCMWGADVTY